MKIGFIFTMECRWRQKGYSIPRTALHSNIYHSTWERICRAMINVTAFPVGHQALFNQSIANLKYPQNRCLDHCEDRKSQEPLQCLLQFPQPLLILSTVLRLARNVSDELKLSDFKAWYNTSSIDDQVHQDGACRSLFSSVCFAVSENNLNAFAYIVASNWLIEHNSPSANNPTGSCVFRDPSHPTCEACYTSLPNQLRANERANKFQIVRVEVKSANLEVSKDWLVTIIQSRPSWSLE